LAYYLSAKIAQIMVHVKETRLLSIKYLIAEMEHVIFLIKKTAPRNGAVKPLTHEKNTC
jgi:hypothetical protein